MIDFLLGVPGKLKTISDLLTANWTAARAAKIDYLDATISSRAPASTAVSNVDYTPARAAALDSAASTGTNPILSPPIANGLPFPSTSINSNPTYLTLVTACAGQYAISTSTSYTAIVNVTGKGVLNFLAFSASNVGGSLRLTIDGVVIFTVSASYNNIYVGAAQVQSVSPYDVLGITYGNIPFKQSLLIEHLSSTSGQQIATIYKYHRTA
jgi:hypothetical protein